MINPGEIIVLSEDERLEFIPPAPAAPDYSLAAYRKFLEGKIHFDHACGFEIDPGEVNPILIPHQRDCVVWAVRGGRRALFEKFGLGKTVQQLEILRLILKHVGGGHALLTMPLGVRQEFKADAELLGWKKVPRFVRRDSEVDEEGIYFTNYESVREGLITPNLFKAGSLDEASVLRSYGSKTYQTFLTLFDQVDFRFVATATPDPNRYKELIHYAGFLGIMDTGQALTRFFQRDPSKAGNLTLYPHKEKEFWLWVHSWAIFLQKPSDLGYSDEGYELPPRKVTYHEIKVSHEGAGEERDGQKLMFKNAAAGLREAAREKRDTLQLRIGKMMDILLEDPDSHYILWHDLEAERAAIEAAIPGVKSVYGSLDQDEAEARLVAFGNGKEKYLPAKPEMSGSGGNYQRHCHKAIFCGIGYKFNDFIQAIHRIYRYLQRFEVEIHIIYADSEREVLDDLLRKWARHDAQAEEMSKIIREYGLNHISLAQTLTRSIGVERREESGNGWTVVNNDCVVETYGMPDNSVDMIVTSIPFSNHYEYTPSYNDFGHTDGNDHFWRQMEFLSPQLLRILKPGRIAAIHTKDRILFGNVTGTGVPTVSPFHAEAIFHYRQHGFDYMGMITVVTDVVRENNQTYRLGWTENCKDGTKMGVGSPEYIVLLRKPQSDRTRGYADVPVAKEKRELVFGCKNCGYLNHNPSVFIGDELPDGAMASECPKCGCGDEPENVFSPGYSRARWQIDAHAFWRSSGNRLVLAQELAKLKPDALVKAFNEYSLEHIYDYDEHIEIGEALELAGTLSAKFMSIAPGSHDPGVWTDVNRMFTLNSDQNRRGLEKHVCPLQFDIVDRLINRYTNKGEVVFDPFGGIFTVPVRALHLDRQGRAVELNPDYYRDGISHLLAMQEKKSIPDMFELIEAEAKAEGEQAA